MTTWTVTYLMHSTLLIAVVALATRWTRSAPARDILWKLALLGGIVTASLQTAVPFDRFVPETARMTVEVADLGAVRTSGPPALSVPPPTGVPEVRTAPQDYLPYLWLAAASFLLARLVYGRRRLVSMLASRRELVTGPDREIVDELSEAMGIRRVVRLTQSPTIGSPMALPGWEIVVPADVFLRLSDEQRRTILAHELAHLKRRDPLWLTLAELVKAVLVFQPLHWYVQARLKETAEFLCDDAAVAQTGDRKALAETLAELAENVTPMPATVAAMAEGGSNLIVRVSRVLRAQAADLPLRLRSRLAIVLVPVLAMAIFAPGVVPALTPAPSERKATRTTTTTRTDANTVSDVNLSHTYDGTDGHTNIRLDAKNASIAHDGSWVRFLSANGFVRVTYTAERAPTRRIEVTPGAGNAPVYRYEIDRRAVPWSPDAERLLVAAFTSKELGDVKVKPAPRRPEPSHDDKGQTWNATVEYTGSRDGEPTYISIRAVDVQFDKATNVLTFGRRSSLQIIERVGSRERSLYRDADSIDWRGDFDGMTERERTEWALAIVRKNTELKGILGIVNGE